MNVLRIFLSAVAGLCGLAALFGLSLVFGAHFTGHLLIGGALTAVTAPLAYVIWKQGQQYTIQSSTEQHAQFEDTFRALAAQHNGVAEVPALMKATGFPRDRVEQLTRELIAKGVCEIDFAESGDMLYRLTPTDEARAQLTAAKDRA